MYKVHDFLVFMTKEPHAHLNSMFGHNNLTYDDFNKSEYKGYVVGVLNGWGYTMITISPLNGFLCSIHEDDIVRPLEPEEVAELEKMKDFPFESLAPNAHRFWTKKCGDTLEQRCGNRAREAMALMFPDNEILSVKLQNSFCKKDDIMAGLRELAASFDDEDRKAELDEFCSWFLQEMKEKDFPEHYTVYVETYSDDAKTGTVSFIVAMDIKLEQVSVMRNEEERARFIRSLGPGFGYLESAKTEFIRKLLQQG